jgi:hypothetical protein
MLMNVEDWPVQAMVDKFCKNKAWQVMWAKYDYANRKIIAECMLSANTSETRTATYEDICKMFSWKSYKITDNGLHVLPKPDAEAFYNAPTSTVEYDAEGKPIIKRKRRARKTAKAKAK